MHPLMWLRLARWLGPWTSVERMPEAHHEVLSVDLGPDQEPTELWTWRPLRGPPRGALFLIPGLHFGGPAHPRLVRLAKIGAHAGLLTAAPALPDFLKMRVSEQSSADAMRCFEAFVSHPEMPPVRPGLMSISFGAHPALHIASSQSFRERVGGTLCFGGYLDWKAPIRYSWEDGPGVPYDSRNNPVAYTFLMKHLPKVPDPGSVLAAWDRYIRQTWGIEEMRPEAPRRVLASELGASLDEAERRLFLQGCRMEEGALELLQTALNEARDMDWLHTGSMLAELRSPLIAMHSMDDEISPPDQSRALVEACPDGVDARLHLTGLYGHSGLSVEGREGSLFAELRTFAQLVSAILEISTGRL
jgi:pimeloyl-ACP methyl ester carboxylesterase